MRSLIRGVAAHIAGCGSTPAGDKGSNWSTLTQADRASPKGHGTRGAEPGNQQPPGGEGHRWPLQGVLLSALGVSSQGGGWRGGSVSHHLILLSPPLPVYWWGN